MNLLRIDHNLLILHLETNTVFNITDNIAGDTIRKIIFSNTKIVILTSTQLYYILFNKRHINFEITDFTNDITKFISISNIKFIGNICLESDNFHIITHDNKIFNCSIWGSKFHHMRQIQYECANEEDINVVAVSSGIFGIIYENKLYNATHDKKNYNVGYFKYGCIQILHGLINIPQQFTSPHQFTESSSLREIVPKMLDSGVITHINDHQTILLDTTREIVYVNTKQGLLRHCIGHSYFHTENLLQYTNTEYDIIWTPDCHQTFGKYTDKLVRYILLCYRKCKYTKYVPRKLLFYMLKFVL